MFQLTENFKLMLRTKHGRQTQYIWSDKEFHLTIESLID